MVESKTKDTYEIAVYLNSLKSFNHKEISFEGESIPLIYLIRFVGSVVIARDTYPDLPLKEALHKLMEDAGSPAPPSINGKVTVQLNKPGCGSCGGGAVK